MPSLLNDNECDAMCNVESCDFDRGDCFHDNTEVTLTLTLTYP